MSTQVAIAAQVVCGDIIRTDGSRTLSNPIDDCNDPFQQSVDAQPIEFSINGEVIEEGDTVTLDLETTVSYNLAFPRETGFAIAEIFKVVDDDYVADYSNQWLEGLGVESGGIVNEPGAYALVVSVDYIEEIDDDLILTKLFRSIFASTVYAFVPSTEVTVINFTVEQADLEPPLSELLLQYEPILQFHEDEDYFPMNVEAFVEGSGLWDSTLIDEVIIPRVADPVDEINELTLEYLATTTDTSNWYIAFSSDEPGDFNLVEAKARYDALVAAGKAVPTYYAHQSEHSYTDDLGNPHNFIVLQYWYFYAMNDWESKDGFNDHEGDWESVFVFLDRDTEEPEYVAYSAHHNDSDPTDSILQIGSVRRSWDKAWKSEDQVRSYVSLGSHAIYGEPGSFDGGLGTDVASGNGDVYNSEQWQKRNIIANYAALVTYEGLFGTNAVGPGKAGTQGPFFTRVSGHRRFLEPLAWAGIDQITETVLEEPQQDFDLINQNSRIEFAESLPAGAEFSSVPHVEFIYFGTNVDDITLSPYYWDINVSEPNGTFLATTSFVYEDKVIDDLGLDESKFGIYFYNEETDLWEEVSSTVNTTTNTVTFTTDHFSIYAIGEIAVIVENPAEDTTGTSTDPVDTGTSTASSSETIGEEIDTDQQEKISEAAGSGSRTGTRVSRGSSRGEVLGVSSNSEQLRLELMLQLIKMLNEYLYLLRG